MTVREAFLGMINGFLDTPVEEIWQAIRLGIEKGLDIAMPLCTGILLLLLILRLLYIFSQS